LNAIVIFMKNPQPGRVKTRLTPWLSPEEAAELYRAFIQDTVALTARVPDARRSVAFTPPDALVPLQALLDDTGLGWFPQCGGTLGERLRHAFRAAFHEGVDRVVTIGSDSPTLPPDHIVRAFEALKRADAVLGPATDGGYYLIGLARRDGTLERFDPLFEDIAWSTDRVYTQTVEALTRSGLAWAGLPVWTDADQPEDLVRIAGQIRALRRRGEQELCRHTARMLKALQPKLGQMP
jgi:rSAM/selenodomain-associated transferase 1